MHHVWCGLLVLLMIGIAGSAHGEPVTWSVDVAPDGDDAHPGTRQQPLRTLQTAQQRVRELLMEDNQRDIEVVLHEGVYRLAEPLRFGTADSAAPGRTITWRAAEGAQPRISGGRPITGWRVEEDGSFITTIPPVTAGEWHFRDLYINGERRPLARHPNAGFARVHQVGEDRRTHFTFHPGDVPAALDGDMTDAALELVFIHDWSISRTPVATISQSGKQLHTAYPVGPPISFFNMDGWEPHPRYFLQNHPALLDAPGEWHLDTSTGTLRYLPLEGESLDTLHAIAPLAGALIHVRGNPGSPVRGLIFRGLHFEHTAWHPPDRGYAGVQATAHARFDQRHRTFVPAALHFEMTEDCVVEHGSVRRVGGAAIHFGPLCRNNRIVGNVIADVAGNGIMIGEDTARRMGREPWYVAVPHEAASGQLIEHNLIEHCGQTYFGAVGIWVGLAAETTIRRNTIRHLPYSGISVGWLWNPSPSPCRGTLIEANHIHDIMQILSDGGGIYTLGWQPDAVIRDNVIHGIPLNLGRAQSNGMFIDEGSKGLTIERNVIFDVECAPLRFHRAEDNVVRHNVLVLSGEDVPPLFFGRTDESDIAFEDNQVLPRNEFDSAQVIRQFNPVGHLVE